MQLSTLTKFNCTTRFSAHSFVAKANVAGEQISQQHVQFRDDVLRGLRSEPRQLSSMYFYDDQGSALFDEITRQPEYYLTRVEQQILEANADRIADLIGDTAPLCVVDLGAGSGEKTHCLLEKLAQRGIDTAYVPIDVSRAALCTAKRSMQLRFPGLQIDPIQDEYVAGLARVRSMQVGRRLLILWLGSSIGNLHDSEATAMLRNLTAVCDSQDVFLIGFDLVKSPQTLIAAYADTRGVTAEFNYNLLRRINRELDGTFHINSFLHHAVYSPLQSRMESYLISRKHQTVTVAGHTFSFDAWEPIRTEISCKYTPQHIEELLRDADMQQVMTLSDTCNQFADVVCMRSDSRTL